MTSQTTTSSSQATRKKRHWMVKLPKYVVDDWFSKDRPDQSSIGRLEFVDTADKSNHGMPQVRKSGHITHS